VGAGHRQRPGGDAALVFPCRAQRAPTGLEWWGRGLANDGSAREHGLGLWIYHNFVENAAAR